MHRRLALALALAVAGAALLVSASLAGTSSSAGSAKASKSEVRRGGTLRLNVSNTDYEYLDPALAYDSIGWATLFAVNMQLMNYPDKPISAGGNRLQPEAAAGVPTVSRDGKTYTFRIRDGLRFSDGSPVTAAAFQRAFVRACHPDQASPAVAFAKNVVGCSDFNEKKVNRLAGVVARGQTLIVRLIQADPTFLAQASMPFFAAVKPTMPINAKGENVYPSAGPYRIVSREPGRSLVLERNRQYRGDRPANPDRIVVTVNTDQNQSLLQVRRGESDHDLGGLPATAIEGLANEFGVNKERFFVNPLVGTGYMALNTARPTFADVNTRKAANYAVDRPAYLRTRGKFGGKRTDQILAPQLPGFRNAQLYPIKGSDYDRAKQLLGANAGKEINLLHTTSAAAINAAQVVKYNLEQIGLKVNLRPQPFGVAINTMGTRGTEMDAFLIGWIADYFDPYDFINVLLDGSNIQAQNNNNYSYWNNPAYNKKMQDAAKLSGDARYKAYGDLDIDIMKNQAPWVPLFNFTARDFIGPNVENFIFHPVYGHAVINALARK
jgi:ABC-type transport system substrate-binding protein